MIDLANILKNICLALLLLLCINYLSCHLDLVEEHFSSIFFLTQVTYWIRQELNEDNILFSKCHFTKDGNSDDKSNDETSKECVCLCLGFQWLFSKWLRWCEGQTGENHSLILKTNATSSEECREMAHLSQSEGGLWAPDQ